MNLVSIITPVYNSEKYLAENIASVQSQTYANWEHILVDDYSTDKSADIILQCAAQDSRIKYIKLLKNSGAGIARNTAIKAAKGKYIAFLDSDDLWHPDKLKKQITFMEKNECYFSFTSYDIINEKGSVIKKNVEAKKTITYQVALYKNPIGCLTVIYDVQFFGKQLMPAIRKRQDYALWLKLLKTTNAYGINESLASYRKTTNSISSNKWNLIRYEWKIYREEEKLSLLSSSFYLFSAIVLKLKSYF